jgi:hypothetical protein
MNPDEVLRQLAEGTTLEGPHGPEPVRVLTAKARGKEVCVVRSPVSQSEGQQAATVGVPRP